MGAVEVVGSLVDRSLVLADEQDGVTRYRMLESVRAYALAKLRASGEEPGVRTRQLRWLETIAGDVDRLDAERDNLREALTWDDGDPSLRLELATSAVRMWELRGHWTEGRELLAITTIAARGSASDETLGRAALNTGLLHWNLGDLRAARASFEESLDIVRRTGDRRGISAALTNLAVIATDEGDLARAADLCNEALTIHRELGDRMEVAQVLGNLGEVARLRGDRSGARSYIKQSLRMYEELGDRRGVAGSHINLGALSLDRGDLATARTHLEASLRMQRDLGDRRWAAHSLHMLAVVASREGDHDGARTMVEECLEVQRTLGDQMGVAYSLATLGSIDVELGRHGSAIGSAEEALRIAAAIGEHKAVASCLDVLASSHEAAGDLDRAALVQGAADAAWARIGPQRDPADGSAASARLARLRAALGDARFEERYARGASMSVDPAVSGG